MDKKQIFLLDAHALCYRSFYAIRDLANSKGQPTNAVFGFSNVLRKILREHNPHYLVACFDSKEKTRRQEKYAEYKIQRQPMPEALISQIPLIKDVLRAFQIPVFEVPGYEADDLMAGLTRMYSDSDIEVILVTDDKDMYQLINENVRILSLRNDKIMGRREIEEKIGFDPRRITDMIALAGDSSDNIPGVRGIGKVTATGLIKQFDSLENMYRNLDDIPQTSVREKLRDQREAAEMSRDLAILEADCPLDVDLESFRRNEPDRDTLFRIFKDLEFGRLAREFIPDGEDVDHSDPEWERRSVETDQDWRDFRNKVSSAKRCALHVDRSGGEMHERIYCYAGGDEVLHFPVSEICRLREWGNLDEVLWINDNLKAFYKLLRLSGINSKIKTFDVSLAGFLLSANQSGNSLSELSWHFLNRHLSNDLSPEAVLQSLTDLYPVLDGRLNETDLRDVFTDIEQPLSYVLALLEERGVVLDLKLLKNLSEQCREKMETLTESLYRLAGESFNLNSPKQLQRILFEKLELPPVKRTKTGFSTDESVLSRLAPNHEVPSLILEYRMLSKLKSTYLDALPKLVDSVTGKIHAEFNQIGTETGRLSSRNPNLQNIPIRTEIGRKIRKAFIPSENGWGILKADYSQVELRILAHMSRDEQLLRAFQNDEDIHRYTASLIFDIPEEEVDSRMRDTAKRVNFGIVYGMSGFGLAKDLGIDQKDANEFISKYFSRYPGVKSFMDAQIAHCRDAGYVTTLFKRRRYLPEINSRNPNSRQFAERQAVNTPVQGSAADLIKLAMIRVQTHLETGLLKGRMLITVHDELVFETPADESDALAILVKSEMEKAVQLTVPLKADLRFGMNWLETEEVLLQESLS